MSLRVARLLLEAGGSRNVVDLRGLAPLPSRRCCAKRRRLGGRSSSTRTGGTGGVGEGIVAESLDAGYEAVSRAWRAMTRCPAGRRGEACPALRDRGRSGRAEAAGLNDLSRGAPAARTGRTGRRAWVPRGPGATHEAVPVTNDYLGGFGTAESATPDSKANLVRLGGRRGAVVAAGAAMATGGAMGRGAAAYRAARERVGPTSSACSRRSACGSRISGVARCRDSASTHPRSVSRRRVRPRESSFQRWPRRRPSASASSTAESGSEGNALSGARALRAGRSPSTGGSCSRHLRCWTTWSCTSSVTCASRTTRDGSGRSSSDIARTGASSAIGCVTTDPSSWHSALRSDPPDRHRRTHRQRHDLPERWPC